MSRTHETDELRTKTHETDARHKKSHRTESDAIVVKREPMGPVETDEIEALVEAAGYDVVGTLTQIGPEDPGSHVGSGKLDELATRVRESGVSRVVVDATLSPGQHHAIESELPEGTRVYDRYRLVLEVFETRAGTHRAQLQVELEQLRYDLPRLRETADEGMLNRRTESGTPLYDVRDRIDRLERKLDDLPDPAEQARERRREQGFDLVSIVGYTNAGKSTLLHRLADELTLSSAHAEGSRSPNSTSAVDEESNKHATASIANRLFETLETTTRRATVAGRPILVTDTVGFVDGLPHDLVVSFSPTLAEASAADVVLLVVDASDPLETFREKLDVSLDVLGEQGVSDERIVTALNKIDLVDDEVDPAHDKIDPADDGTLGSRLHVAKQRTDAVIPVSVVDGTNVGALEETILDRLPTTTATITMRNCDRAMRIVSRAYDRTTVESVDYLDGVVRLECRGRPVVLDRLRGEAEAISV